MAATKKKQPARPGSLKVDRKGEIYELQWVCVGQTARGCGGGAAVKSGPRKVRKKSAPKKRATAAKRTAKKAPAKKRAR